jgi:cation diffusion facilitator family transporter
MSIALIIGILLSSRKSQRYPYGLYKVENIVSVVIALLVFLTAYEIVMEALSYHGVQLPYSGWILIVVSLLIPVPYLLGTYEVKVGKKYNSPSLIADGRQHKVDVLTASIVFFALLAQYFGVPLDRVAAIIIALFVFRAGWAILKDSMRTLLDASVDYHTLDKIRSIICSDPMVKNIISVTGRNSGRYIFVEAIVTLHKSDFDKAHHVTERIEGKIRELVPNVDRVLIHYEPEEPTCLRYAVPLQDRKGTISPHFGEAPYFAILDFNVKENRLEHEEVITNTAREEEKRKGILVAKMLLARHPDIVLTKKGVSEKGPESLLQAANIEVRQTEAESLSRIIRQVEQGLLDEKALKKGEIESI